MDRGSRLDSQGSVAQRTSRRLTNEGNLQSQFPPVMLRLKLDNELARRWEDGHVSLATLWDDFAKYVYLPRLRDQDVLLATVESGPAATTWQSEGFATAVGTDETTGRYLGLVGGSHPGPLTPTALVVRAEFALGQFETDAATEAAADSDDPGASAAATATGGTGTDDVAGAAPGAPAVTRFHGAKAIDTDRPMKDFSAVTDEVLQHLVSLLGADVRITLEITATKPDGFDERTVRTVTENTSTLKFDPGSGFSRD